MKKGAFQATYEKEKYYWWYRARADILEYVFENKIVSFESAALSKVMPKGIKKPSRPVHLQKTSL